MRVVLLHTGGNSLPMLGFYIAPLGVEIKVLEPPELVQELEAVAGHLMRAVSRTTSPESTIRWRCGAKLTTDAADATAGDVLLLVP